MPNAHTPEHYPNSRWTHQHGDGYYSVTSTGRCSGCGQLPDVGKRRVQKVDIIPAVDKSKKGGK